MTRDEHRAKAMALISEVEDELLTQGPKTIGRDIAEACYTFGELNLMGELDALDAESAIRIWALVEKVRRDGFPKELKM